MMLVFNPEKVEELARELHAGTKEVQRQEPMWPPQGHLGGPRGPYIEIDWDDLTEKAREDYRVQARYLIERYDVTPKRLEG